MNETAQETLRDRITGRKRGANRLYRVPSPSTNIGSGSPSSPTTIAAIPIRFRKPGIAVAMYGQVLSAVAADAAGLEVRVQLGGTRDLFTDGDSGTFVPYFALFGSSQNWFPLDLGVTEGQDWSVTWRNVGSNAVMPSLIISVFEPNEVR